ncbi:MAG: toxin-antitoxin system HicB family antitoxin [Nitrospinae bacterium]|nr:toxin-antitoxin system HicB family antitoxin [Nitrospinota bacterium]
MAYCARINKYPNKPMSGSFNVRIGQELHRRAAVRAAGEGISLNDLVKRSVEHYVLSEEPSAVHA